jgi:hypothetical protein
MRDIHKKCPGLASPFQVRRHRSRYAPLPIEQPTKFELFVNLKAANMLGVIIPESFLLRADKVIYRLISKVARRCRKA